MSRIKWRTEEEIEKLLKRLGEEKAVMSSDGETAIPVNPGEVVEVPTQEDFEALTKGPYAEKAPSVDVKELVKEEPEIPEKLINYLDNRGFTRALDRRVYHKEAAYCGRNVRLTVDFEKSRDGARYGYDLDSDRSDKSLREHPDLVQFKRLRDGEIALEEAISLAETAERKEVGVREEEGVALPETMKLPPGEEGQVVALKMEAKDDEQIEKEALALPVEAIHDWFYQFKHKGRTVTGLSYLGTVALMRMQKNIDVRMIENAEEEDCYRVKARAIDKARNITFERMVRQPKKMKLKSGKMVKDDFADRKAESKAIKKALQAIVSPRVVVRMYEKWLASQR